MSGRTAIGALHGLSAALLLLLCAAVYSNTLQSPFTFDDGHNIVDNELIQLKELDASDLLRAGFESRAPRPIAYMSFALNYYFGEYEVRGYHVVNIVIHWLSGFLVYWLALDLFRRQRALRRGGGNPNIAPGLGETIAPLIAAAIFIAHPIQTQSVTYIVQRMSSMAAMFYLLALVLYVCGRDREGRRRGALWVGAGVCWLLALGSKQTAATFPLLVLLYEWFFFQNLSLAWLKRRLSLVLSVAFSLVCAAVLFVVLIDTAFEYEHRDFNLIERLLTQSRVIIRYLSLLVWPLPSRLNLTHDVSVSHSLMDPPTTILSILALLALFVFSLRMAQSQRILSFCILWFFIHLFIESSFVALELMFEHRLYLPMLGFSVLVAYGIESVLARRGVWAMALSAGLVLALGLGAYERNKVWQDEYTLWSDVVAKSPDDFRAHSQLGKIYRSLGDLDQATVHLSRSIELNENFFPPHWNMAGVSLDSGDRREAIRHLRGALAVDVYDARGNPYVANAHRQISKLLIAEGEWSEAREHSVEALRLSPDRPISMMRLAWILMKSPGHSAEEIEEAVELAERADALTEHAAPRVLDTLATTYVAAGRFSDAAKVVRDMLEIDLAAEGTRADKLRARLGEYEKSARDNSGTGFGSAPIPADALPLFSDVDDAE